MVNTAKFIKFSTPLIGKTDILKFNNARPINTTTQAAAAMATSAASTTLVGPAVKLLLFHYNLPVDSVQNRSGPKKNVLKSDVCSHINAMKLAPVKRQPTKIDLSEKKTASRVAQSAQRMPPPPTKQQQIGQQKRQKFVDLPLTNMRQTIARRLSQSKSTIPHAYVSAYISADNVQHLREKFVKSANLKLSLNDFIVKACAQTLRAFPELNVQWKEEGGGSVLRSLPTVDISVAVATPNGLITPILFGADKLGMDQIGRKMRELAEKAREGRLRPEEFQGGTFTISNLGMFGSVSTFTAIINPPQAAILAVGGLSTDPAGDVTHFGVTLCYDARAIRETDAQRFVQTLQLALAEPGALLVGMEVGGGQQQLLELDDLDAIEQAEEEEGEETGAANLGLEDAKAMAKFLI